MQQVFTSTTPHESRLQAHNVFTYNTSSLATASVVACADGARSAGPQPTAARGCGCAQPDIAEVRSQRLWMCAAIGYRCALPEVVDDAARFHGCALPELQQPCWGPNPMGVPVNIVGLCNTGAYKHSIVGHVLPVAAWDGLVEVTWAQQHSFSTQLGLPLWLFLFMSPVLHFGSEFSPSGCFSE
eukprot:scaffold12188_cov23-Tisochrysis_lutea.AAC.1